MLLKNLFSRSGNKKAEKKLDAQALRTEAATLNHAGKIREAATKFKEYLERCPHDIPALNDYGVALATIGKMFEAAEVFHRALELDDAYLPTLVNFANILKEGSNSTEALKHIITARIQDPDTPGVHACYAALVFAWGHADTATRHTLAGWLGNFNSLRSANQHLFTSTYAALSEPQLAAEHRFWAETLPPLPAELQALASRAPTGKKRSSGPLKIGYWSPDMREHSVRYFFRPLLEGHDATAVNTFIFHDSFTSDAQTDLIKKASNHFIDVSELSDQEVAETILDCDLDVLVELAGHTSYNRLDLLRLRLAPLQVTGIGYPPTTGLSTIDIKLSDPYISHADAQKCYTEHLAVMPSSFWCFNPLEDISIQSTVASERNGHITFACFGNIAKITDAALSTWSDILKAVPQSQLLIRATNFVDPTSRAKLEERLKDASIPADRVQLALPEKSKNLFHAYEAVDIILDTFPFNGGTTTCYATYMGIPVVSLVGEATAGRMGLSILSNLGLQDLAVHSWSEYTKKAIALAADTQQRTAFKNEARALYQSTALGNGKIFAKDFEDLCRTWLDKPLPPAPSSVSPLPPAELVQRARRLFRSNNFDAAHRVVDYCIREHPHYPAAHILHTQRMAESQRFDEACNYLAKIATHLTGDDWATVTIQKTRYHLLQQDMDGARESVAALRNTACSEKHSTAIRLLQLAVDMQDAPEPPPQPQAISQAPTRFRFLIPIGLEGGFQIIKADLEYLAEQAGATIDVVMCPPIDKTLHYQKALQDTSADIVVLMQPSVTLHSSNCFEKIAKALDQFDVISYFGADRWENMDWRNHVGQRKYGSLIMPSGEQPGAWELHILGEPHASGHDAAAVLDGMFLAMRRTVCAPMLNDDVLVATLEEADCLSEDFLAHQLGRSGARLGVCSTLGLSVDWRMLLPRQYIGQARQYIYEQLGFDPLKFEEFESVVAVAPVPTPEAACALQDAFFAL
ncbi:MAG: hypothetical protein QM740_05320 [Acidovorax sp.]